MYRLSCWDLPGELVEDDGYKRTVVHYRAVAQYRFNTKIAPDCTVLQRTEKKGGNPSHPSSHFASLIPFGERIDEGIKSKEIMDIESLSSMVEQQVKRMIGHKTKEADVYLADNASKRPRGVTPTYATPATRLYQQQNQSAQAPNRAFNQRGRPDLPRPPKRENQNTLRYPCPGQISMITYQKGN
ncbi:hypothetical protein SO802_012411 [Lithocarpus litseifolius]|uniref:Uncharacterized protein n=1 Tax=Lithocarpus litseifolius TaxID=425828 RepID=A0AAW2D689_9ROSI